MDLRSSCREVGGTEKRQKKRAGQALGGSETLKMFPLFVIYDIFLSVYP